MGAGARRTGEDSRLLYQFLYRRAAPLRPYADVDIYGGGVGEAGAQRVQRVPALLGLGVLRTGYDDLHHHHVAQQQRHQRGHQAASAATIRLACHADADGAPIPFPALQAKLHAAGYARVPEVTEPGQYAVRGGVLDAWSPSASMPVRAEFFGDDLESLRTFDPALQTSTGACRRERRHGRDIEMGVMHDMGLTSEGGDEQHEGAVERDVEAQIEQHLRDHIARGGL